MNKTQTVLTLVVLVGSATFLTAAKIYASTYPGAHGRAATAPGQIIADAKCAATIERQNANGQVRDSTIGPTAVTNCDHFWQTQP